MEGCHSIIVCLVQNKLTDNVLNFPTNAAIKCRLTLPPLEGTSYEPVYRNVFSPDEQVTVTCGEKYWITSPRHTSAVTTCTDSGEWTIRPVCKGKKTTGAWVLLTIINLVSTDLKCKIPFQRLHAAINARNMCILGMSTGGKKWYFMILQDTGVGQTTRAQMAATWPHAPEMGGDQIHFVKVWWS